jgi:thiamine-phosphate pyrophosphorylase
MVSGTGFRLLSEEGVEAMRRDLLPLASLVTPNAPEAAMLSGLEVGSADQAEEAGRRILERGAAAVLITGGHFRRDRGTDVLVTPGAVRRYVSRCLDSPEVHGTGCVLASAIATHLGGGAPLGEAIARAKALVTEAIGRAAAVGDGARFADPLFFLERESALKEVGALHVITDESVQDRFSHVDLARLCAEGGADRVQFREKRPCSTRRMVETVRRMREAAEERGARVVVNDRVDVALAAGAAAAHLGWDDLEARVARRLLGEEALIGVTVNGEEEAQRAAALPVDYLGVGPVFGTRSKANPAPVLGLDGLRDIVRRVGKPVIAVGSITAERVGEVLDTGARGVAVLSAVVGDPDPREATRRLREALEAGRGAAAGR